MKSNGVRLFVSILLGVFIGLIFGVGVESQLHQPSLFKNYVFSKSLQYIPAFNYKIGKKKTQEETPLRRYWKFVDEKFPEHAAHIHESIIRIGFMWSLIGAALGFFLIAPVFEINKSVR